MRSPSVDPSGTSWPSSSTMRRARSPGALHGDRQHASGRGRELIDGVLVARRFTGGDLTDGQLHVLPCGASKRRRDDKSQGEREASGRVSMHARYYSSACQLHPSLMKWQGCPPCADCPPSAAKAKARRWALCLRTSYGWQAMPLIALEDVSTAFGHVPLLDHAGLLVEPGERVAVIGRNGAGKSTLLEDSCRRPCARRWRGVAGAGTARRAARAGRRSRQRGVGL